MLLETDYFQLIVLHDSIRKSGHDARCALAESHVVINENCKLKRKLRLGRAKKRELSVLELWNLGYPTPKCSFRLS